MKRRTDVMRFHVLPVALAVTVLMLWGCTGQNGQAGTGQDTASGQSEPPVDSKPSEAPAGNRIYNSPDLANYPMPTELPGQERLPGSIVSQPHDRTKGASGDLLVTSVNDTLVVTVCAMRINCCTERLAAALETTELGVDVILYEYLPDVCECFHEREISFRIFPAPTAGQTLRVRANDRQEILAVQVME